MGIEKVGISLIQNIVKAKGGSVLRSKPSVFHGINPTLRYTENGKIFALPRFITPEMQEARAMNQIAIRQAKTGNVVRTYPKAASDDLKRLTSESLEDSFSRVEWTNPKDGKLYNLLKQGETEDGKVIVRILDEEGAFIKEVQLEPKNIKILDDFSSGTDYIKSSSSMFDVMTHGDIVATFAKRYNPFASIELIDINGKNTIKNLYSEIEKLQSRINKGERIDFVSLSSGIRASKEESISILKELGLTPFEVKSTNISLNHPQIIRYPVSEFAIKNRGSVRVIQSSGNFGKDNINIWLSYPEIEGCGSLSLKGKIAGFSASRDSLLTQHYEQGFFQFQPKRNGLSLTDGRNLDIPLRKDVAEKVEVYLGKKPILTSPEENVAIATLKKKSRDKYYERLQGLYSKEITPAEKTQLERLKNEANVAKRSGDKKRIMALKLEYDKIANSIKARITPLMNDFTCPEIEKYRKMVQSIKRQGKVQFSGFSGEYHVPSENPLELKNELSFQINKSGVLELQTPRVDFMALQGTSFSTPIRTAKLALNDMMEGVL